MNGSMKKKKYTLLGHRSGKSMDFFYNIFNEEAKANKIPGLFSQKVDPV